MAETLLRVFDSFDIAQRARSALIAAGMPESAVEMRPQEDDGGPPQGNFVVDLEEQPTPAVGDPNRQSAQSELRTPVQRASCLLVVQAADADQHALASRVLDQVYSIDHPDRLDSRQGPGE
jgi:hypothetical protein